MVWTNDGVNGNYSEGAANDNGIYMSELSATNTLPPVAKFNANLASGAALTVLFTDTGTERGSKK